MNDLEVGDIIYFAKIDEVHPEIRGLMGKIYSIKQNYRYSVELLEEPKGNTVQWSQIIGAYRHQIISDLDYNQNLFKALLGIKNEV